MQTIKTDYWHRINDKQVECDLCPRHCRMVEGGRGVCHIRGCQNGEVQLLMYGQASGIAVDPIEKKPLAHFLPGSSVLSFGTIGCNLTCKFCQNWHISRSDSLEEYISASPEYLVGLAEENNCQSIAFTYNEPVIFMEYARDVSTIAKSHGLKTVAVTAGYINPEPRKEFFSFIDAVNIDLKSFSESFYQKFSGVSLDPVLDTLKYLKNETDVWMEITTLLIPGENDSDREINDMTLWIVENLGTDVPIHFSAFHPAWKMMDRMPTTAATVLHAKDIAIKNGIRHVHTGNI